MSQSKPFSAERWQQFWANYNDEPQQRKGIELLRLRIQQADLGLLTETADWVTTFRQAPDYSNDWDGIVAAAKDAGAKYPELVAAQWQLESGHGQQTTGTHNYFGLKGTGTKRTTQEEINGQMVTVTDSFLNFSSLRDCVEYLVTRWYLDFKGYKGVNNYPTVTAAAHGLKEEGYATDSSYPSKLIRILAERGVLAADEPATPKILKVPYFSQKDNASGTGYRECFSSSCAMVAAFYGKVITDDQYNNIRANFGDTTSCEAQLRALRFLGLKANFHTNGTNAKIKALLAEGIPVPVGWLHHGPNTSPSGSGHWSVIIGTEGEKWVVNDPAGQADLVKGGYTHDPNGHGERYSFKNFGKRWEVDGPGTGWYLEVRR